MAEAVVGEAQGLREHPAFAVVLGEERLDAAFSIAVSRVDLYLEVVERDGSQNGAAQFRGLVPVYAPEPLGVPGGVRAVTRLENGIEIRRVQSQQARDDRVHGGRGTDSGVVGQEPVRSPCGALPRVRRRDSLRAGELHRQVQSDPQSSASAC